MKSRFLCRSFAAAFVGTAVYSQNIQAEAKEAFFLETGVRTSQPIGHYEFCQINPKECKKTVSKPPLNLTKARWNILQKINSDVNNSVMPETDLKIFGKDEVWAFPKDKGDCEDYVLEKRRRLIAAKFPESNLLITVVRQRNGYGHAVLSVVTDRGDFILDNLEEKILPANETNYKYLKRVSNDHAERWVKIDYDGIKTGSTNSIVPVNPTP